MAQRYNTGNQRPSNSMKDLNDNALVYDDFLNGDADEVIDRLGKSMPTIRKTIRDANDKFHSQITLQDSLFLNSQIDKENRFASFLDSSGYVFLGEYQNGPFQFSARNQYIRYNNQYYRLNAATDVGFTTTGTDATSFANDVTHFVLMDGDTFRQNLSSSEPGMGAYIPAYKRQWALELINNVATYLNAGKVNLWEYRHLALDTIVDGAEVVDWTPALIQALVDGAKYKRQVYAPGGRYYFQKMPEFVNLDSSGSTTNMSMYSLVGDGHDKTIFWTDSLVGVEMHFSTCRFYFDKFSVQRVLQGDDAAYRDSTIPLMQLGRRTDISAARLGYMGDVRFNGSPWGLNIEHCWDSIFQDVIVHNFQTSGIRIGIHDVDNSNNLLFIRTHIESCKYKGENLCRAFADMSYATGSRVNHNITLIQPHIEPVNLRCHIFYSSYGKNIKVINPAFNRNNGSVDEGLYLDPSLAAPAVYSSDGVNIHIDGGQIQHIGPRSDTVAPLFKFVGTHKGWRCDSYIDTGKATSRTDLLSSVDVSRSNNGLREISFKGATVNVSVK
ncbi:phage tail protein [Klebsiella quasipneumoniae subsp. similipneumoniae]|uniref:phage tail protein n=1 Tax=Klebsiella quasipneumoniae TaxID=1463165 RepID=UPI0038D00B50